MRLMPPTIATLSSISFASGVEALPSSAAVRGRRAAALPGRTGRRAAHQELFTNGAPVRSGTHLRIRAEIVSSIRFTCSGRPRDGMRSISAGSAIRNWETSGEVGVELPHQPAPRRPKRAMEEDETLARHSSSQLRLAPTAAWHRPRTRSTNTGRWPEPDRRMLGGRPG